ncbi:hypothetical protein BS50DRAFT_585460 [Corynespora cassiicola Philippines]|uniref:Uncharacterized protein n=1 Tax=Corynespora cassiicola Philippines TaxID=1448308 RepID=A0A2T2NX14_CORCC|nr:hypothetical protein BS50DRAFT_585460 [Corynespora cassiicola Philippines]
MAGIMAQQGLGLTAPSNRQDIVSALLSDYGNSFESPDPRSPYAQDQKELPPPPPDSNETSHPQAGHMITRFPLRVDDPPSPASSNGETSPVEQPRRIASRSLSRSSKPPSLKLIASNGSTASLPPTPPLPAEPVPSSSVPSSTVPSSSVAALSRAFENKSLPPPPPEKSARRQQQPPPSMGAIVSKELRSRKDSIQSQDSSQDDSSVKRKAVPGLSKFKSLAELGNGPRGGKGGPLPPAPRPARKEVPGQAAPSVPQEDSTNQQERSSKQSNASSSAVEVPEAAARPAAMGSQMPPTPEENPLPPPPKKALAPVGLPSNPRGTKLQHEASIKHLRGKSSTGFDMMKDSSEQIVAPAPNTITPGPTPPPHDAEQIVMEKQQDKKLPDSPLSFQDGTAGRRYSFEAPAPPVEQQQQEQQPVVAAPAAQKPGAAPAVSSPSQFPPRTTSRAPAPTTPTTTAPAAAPATLNPHPASPIPESATLPQNTHTQSSSISTSAPPTSPFPISPLPKVDLPAPPITDRHLHCYTSHRQTVRSQNAHLHLPCMVCKGNRFVPEMRACAWCYLRVCSGCWLELARVPGREVGVLVERKRKEEEEEEREKKSDEGEGEGGPVVVVSGVEGERGEEGREDFS